MSTDIQKEQDILKGEEVVEFALDLPQQDGTATAALILEASYDGGRTYDLMMMTNGIRGDHKPLDRPSAPGQLLSFGFFNQGGRACRARATFICNKVITITLASRKV